MMEQPLSSAGSGAGGGASGATAGDGITVTDGVVAVKAQVRAIDCRWNKDTTDAAATATWIKRVFYRNNTGVAITLSAVLLNIHNTLAGNDTANFTIIISRQDGAAGGDTVIKSWANTVANGGLVAYVTKDLGALADTTLPAGHVLQVEITKLGAGQTIGVGSLEIVGTFAG